MTMTTMRSMLVRATAGTVGALALLGTAGVAVAEEVGSGQDVDVSVDIAQQQSVGALTMTVADDATTLTEGEPDAAGNRVFTGTLPTVTVTDDRADVPADSFWYVTGSARDFTGASDELTAGNLGWRPQLLTTTGDGEVAVGPDVDTVLDGEPNNVGLVGEEFLAITSDDSQTAAAAGSWAANAELVLKTPADVTSGVYSTTVTLTLWEDEF